MEKKFILNSTQIPNYILDDVMPFLSDTEFRIIMVICRQTYGWHKEADHISYSQLIQKTGASNGSIATSLRSLREKGYIKVLDEKGKQLFTKEDCKGKELFYQINVTSPKIGVHLSKNWTPKIGDTKETITKTLSKDNGRSSKKTPSCPLIEIKELTTDKGFLHLRSKYPNGHSECLEYLVSVEDRRGFKFINKAKQFMFIHKILKAGFGFDAMNKSIRAMEKKYEKGAWDFSNMANWLEKGASNGNS